MQCGYTARRVSGAGDLAWKYPEIDESSHGFHTVHTSLREVQTSRGPPVAMAVACRERSQSRKKDGLGERCGVAEKPGGRGLASTAENMGRRRRGPQLVQMQGSCRNLVAQAGELFALRTTSECFLLRGNAERTQCVAMESPVFAWCASEAKGPSVDTRVHMARAKLRRN